MLQRLDPSSKKTLQTPSEGAWWHRNESIIDILLTDLRSLIANLDKNGGLISPSVYNTLTNPGHIRALESAVDAMLAYQCADGGWGMDSKSTATETAYGVLTLRTLRDYGLLAPSAVDALRKAYQWLLRNYCPFNVSEDKYWIAKELYRPYRIDRAFELSAMLALALEEGSQ